VKTKTLLIFIALLLCGMAHVATKTFEREYTYRASDNDSKNSARAIATTEMRNMLLREVGEYLHSERRSENGEYSEKINAITAGIVEMKVLDEKWDGAFYYIKASMTIDPDEINRRIAEILNDKQKTKELEDARRRIDKAEAEIARLKKELAKNPNNQATMQKYTAATEKLSAEEYFTKGNNAYNNELYELAIEYYQKAIDINPNYADAYLNMGVAYYEQKNYPQAIQYYQKAIEINSNNAQAYYNYNMGNAYGKQGNTTKKVECFRKAARLGDEDAQQWLRDNGYKW
jgi:tetratricopeptide (TPR) repeat protein